MMKDLAMEDKRKARSHTIVMENRQKASLTGVTDVASFHDQEIILLTDDGEITLLGEGLHISQLSLDEGRLVVEGRIVGLEYANAPQAKRAGFWGRLFG